MGRYLERSENITRLLLVTEDFSTETQGLAEQVAQSAWKDLLAIFPPPRWRRRPRRSRRCRRATSPASSSIRRTRIPCHYSLRKARENARSVRGGAHRRGLPGHQRDVSRAGRLRAARLTDPPALRDALGPRHKGLFARSGPSSTRSRATRAWLFLKLGESLERDLIAPRWCCAPSCRPWRRRAARGRGALLHAVAHAAARAGSLENYRRSYGRRLEPELVVPFLLFDPALAALAAVRHRGR
jgi:uncharacterized alpha-E superfamily protein